MAIRTLEGFDDSLYGVRHHYVSGTVSTSYGVDGNGIRVGDITSGYVVLSPDSQNGDVNTFGFNAKVVTVKTSSDRMLCGSLGNLDSGSISAYGGLGVGFDDLNDRLYVFDKTGRTYAAINTFVLGAWYYIELKYTVGDAPQGQWELRVDGVTILSATSRDTKGSYEPIYFRIGGRDSLDVDEMHVDNIYQTDDSGSSNTGFLGPITVATRLPSGNGTTSGMTGSDGNQTDNYLLVDNNATVPPATTEYVESSTEGDLDTYAMDDLTGAPTILGVLTSAYAQRDAADVKYLRPVLRSGTTDYSGSSLVLPNSVYTLVEHVWDVDPDTSTQWAYTGVNAMEVGQEVRDS